MTRSQEVVCKSMDIPTNTTNQRCPCCQQHDQYRHQKKYKARRCKEDRVYRQKLSDLQAEYSRKRYAADPDYKLKLQQRNREAYQREAALRYLKKLFN